MSFVKIDCGILRSTIWFDRPAREVFLTALLLAEPKKVSSSEPQLEVRRLDPTGWEAPGGWYGFVAASGVGIVHLAGVEAEDGMKALERLGSPEGDSRSKEHEGRRMIRVDGGFLVLNFDRYRDKDPTAPERQRRFRLVKQVRAEATAEPPLLTFPCDGTPKQWHVVASQVKHWRELFPSLDIGQECRNALAWVEASPDRRKTVRGMQKFLVGWFGRAQNGGRRGRGGGGSAPPVANVRVGHARAEIKDRPSGEVKL